MASRRIAALRRALSPETRRPAQPLRSPQPPLAEHAPKLPPPERRAARTAFALPLLHRQRGRPNAMTFTPTPTGPLDSPRTRSA